MCQSPLTHHKTFAGNLFDPLGFMGGKKGFMGMGTDKNKANDAKAAAAEVAKGAVNTALPAASAISNVQNNEPFTDKKTKQITSTLLSDNEDTSGPKLY